ncbi:PDR/VanB family oxidoreductase [Burkholderia anthina]|uniref:PDR/VanB family oxidoreductase n=1 Tax=Burkholderia anthina TaxID=179879 RepID=UPI001CF5CB93|nr:PDR/VanB family oxidoreductase [Burkholderia anthina]MCA8094877.1 PDR/VanB family oxidoreductase [Burkholderia anthina]
MATQSSLIEARLVAVQLEARDIVSFVFAPVASTPLPAFTPGSHIDVQLGNGQTRSYSLSNADASANRYRLTVQRDPNSRGASAWMHETLRVGDTLKIGLPRNNFVLEETAPLSVFIAGGIGVTPFMPMMARLNTLGQAWCLHYCVRTPERAAFGDEIELLAAAGEGRVSHHFDEVPGGAMLDLQATIAALPAHAHVYCCGPGGMLKAFRAAAEAIEPERVHFEYFSSNVEAAAEGGFTVRLARSGREFRVQSGQTILHALREQGFEADSSCEEGVCGACETRVISGEPDHRDSILGARERASNKTMMICCSGCKSDCLVLDL